MTDLSREARAILEAAAGADDPTLADKARVHDAVMARVAGAPPAPGAGAGAGSSLGLKLVLAVAVVGGLSVGAYLLVRGSHEPVIDKLEAPAEAPIAAVEPEPAPPLPEPAATAAPEAEPEAEPAPEPVRARPPSRPDRTAAPDLESLLAEKRLISAARRALDEHQPAAALELCEQHAREFPRGQLAAERDGTRVLALCDLGRRDNAVIRAARFLREHRRHPMAARVRASCVASAK